VQKLKSSLGFSQLLNLIILTISVLNYGTHITGKSSNYLLLSVFISTYISGLKSREREREREKRGEAAKR